MPANFQNILRGQFVSLADFTVNTLDPNFWESAGGIASNTNADFTFTNTVNLPDIANNLLVQVQFDQLSGAPTGPIDFTIGFVNIDAIPIRNFAGATPLIGSLSLRPVDIFVNANITPTIPVFNAVIAGSDANADIATNLTGTLFGTSAVDPSRTYVPINSTLQNVSFLEVPLTKEVGFTLQGTPDLTVIDIDVRFSVFAIVS